jgi:single-strand DNA-binding protein
LQENFAGVFCAHKQGEHMSNNTFQFIGNLVNDAETKQTPNTLILNFRLAVSDGYGEKKYTDYHTVKAFGKTAEYNTTLAKGDRVLVAGRVKSNSYEKDGKKVYSTDFVADRIYRIVKVDSEVDPRVANMGRQMDAARPVAQFESFKSTLMTDEDIPF